MVRTQPHPTGTRAETRESPLAGSGAAPPPPRRPMLVAMLAALVVLLLAGIGGALVLALGDSEPAANAPAEAGFTGDWKDTYEPTSPGRMRTYDHSAPASESGTTWTGDWKDIYEPTSPGRLGR
jgi:hypothetical protein